MPANTSEKLTFAPEPIADQKAFATLQAQAALRGYRVDRIDAEAGASTFVVTRWNLTKQLGSLDEVRSFLARAGAGGSHGV